MECSCIREVFDFDIDTKDCSSIYFDDQSEWMTEEYYVVPAVYNIIITGPGGTQAITASVSTDSKTKILSSPCIEDGIYCFQTTSCGVSYTRHKAITCTLECGLTNLVADLDIQDDWSDASTIKCLIASIHSSTEVGNFKQATDLFDDTKKMLNRLGCSC